MSSICDPSEEKTNGTKLARLLVDGGTQALRKIFDSFIHPPLTLNIVLNNNFATLNNLKTRGKIYDSQWEKLFPSTSGDPPDSETFDITLLHLLLREICPLIKPATGWHSMPADTDHSREADIVRIKCFRNDLCHGISTSVPNDAFEDKWKTISHSLVALGLDQLEIDRLKTENIDHDTERRVDEEVQKWKRDFEPRIQNVEQKLEQLEGHISSIQQPILELSGTRELPSCLPDEVQDVFGRSEEINKAVRFLQREESISIVSVTGGPGFGKTTVANKVAHELAKPEYCRSVLWCSLTSQGTLKDIATAMILSCSRSYSQLPENPKAWLLNWSKQQREKVTLILDNADHVLECEDRLEFVNMLRDMRMYSRQNLTFIITSRNTVHSPSGDLKIQNIGLTSLSLNEARKVLLSKVDNVEVRQKLYQTTKMVTLCGRVPLALCIVGSLLSEFKEDRLILSLEKEPLNVLQDKGISVENAIKTSFDLLNETEQKALTAMTVFPGSFDSDAAEAVIAAELSSEAQPIVLLRSLRHRSLLEQQSSCRYEIHQLIQAFVKKATQAKYSQAFSQGEQRACAHFIRRLADNADMYWSKDNCKESVLNFNEDRHNFEYFLEVYVRTMKNHDADSLQTSTTKFLENFPQKCMYLEMCLLPNFYIMILEKLWKYFYTISQPVHTVEVLCLLGHEKRKVGKQAQYKYLMRQAKQVYFTNYKAFKANGLSQVYFFNSYAYFLSVSKLPGGPEVVSNVYEIASILSIKNLNEHPETAVTLQYIGRHKKSMRHLQKAMDMFKLCLGEHFMTAQCHKAIADFYLRQYFYQRNTTGIDKCLEHYGDALTMMENLGVGDHKESILTLKNCGICYKIKGNFQEAMKFLMKAKQVAEIELEEDHKWKVMIETQLALLHECIGNVEEAKEIMRKGLEMSERLNQPIAKLANKREIKEFLNRYSCSRR